MKDSYTLVKQSGLELSHKLSDGPLVSIPPDYISENQHKIDILHYDLHIDLYPDKKLLKGDITITTRFVDEHLNRIDLNFYDNMKIERLSLNELPAKYEHKGSRLSIFSDESSITDTFTVFVKYEGTPRRMGLSAFVFGKINSRSVVYNLNEPVYASTWFPCNDVPSDKALLDIRITNDSSQTSVSNGILINTTTEGDRRTYHWKTIYPISTYLIAVYSSEYEHFTDQYISLDGQDTMTIDYYVFPEQVANARIDFEDHPDMLRCFAELFGEYPFMKEKYGVAVFLWNYGAMEHQTITGIGANFIGGRKFFNDLYAHELAHHWWGNAIAPKTWKDIWLNEGFATYSEALYYEYRSGETALRSTMMSNFNENFRHRLYNPGNDIFSNTVYNKGAWVLHMLRKELGDPIFFNILRQYFERFKYEAASTEDFRLLCEEISGLSLDKFFDQWLYTGTGHIKVDWSWKIYSLPENNVLELTFNQTQTEYPDYYFTLDLLLESDDGMRHYEKLFIDSREKSYKVNLQFSPVKVTPDPDNWLLAVFNHTERNQ